MNGARQLEGSTEANSIQTNRKTSFAVCQQQSQLHRKDTAVGLAVSVATHIFTTNYATVT